MRAAIAMLMFACVSGATEKYWIIHEADLIVVGKMRPNTPLPWFDGWRLSGTVEVSEVLFGPQVGPRIDYRYTCKFCPWWAPPRDSRRVPTSALWFFKRSGNRWEPADGEGSSDLSWRAEVEDYIRKYKRALAK
jgi:hypothetical protein